MKKLYYLMAISCMFLSLPLTSCDDDDDDDEVTLPTEMNGHTTGSKDLTGALTVVVGSTTMDPFYQDLTVNDDYANGTLEIYIDDFTFSFVGQSIAFGELNVKCNYTDGDNFEGSTTVTYGGDIDFAVEGTYDGTNLEFSSSFEVVGQTISFTFSTKQTITEGDEAEEGETMPEFEVPENSTEYVGSLSGSALGGLATFSDDEATIYFNGSVLAMESLSISALGIELPLDNIYINCELGEDGSFTDGTASVWMYGEYLEMEDVEGSIVVTEEGITISVALEVTGISVDINFTNIAAAPSIYDFAGETTKISGTLTTGEGTDGTAVTVTIGVNADGNAVYSISEFSVAGAISSTTYSSVVIVVDGESVSAQVTTTNNLTGSTTYDATSATFTTTDNNDFTATVEYKALISTTTLSLTFTEGTTGSEVTE